MILPRRIAVPVAGAAAALAFAGLMVIAGCRGVAPLPASALMPAMAKPAVGYVGSAICSPCHVAESELHARSAHTHTLRLVSSGAQSAAPPPGPTGPYPYQIQKTADGFRFGRADRPAESEPIQFAVGSGKTAVTYIGSIGSEKLTEFRVSYDPGHRTWFTTPGQVGVADLELGTRFEGHMATKCILCHADTLAAGSAEPAKGAAGVGCESCHGPGKAHIEAVQRHDLNNLAMERMRTWDARKVNALCARCHRSVNDVALDQSDASSTARFQPYGLEQSPCFQKSGGRLSCLTCHDAHADASTDKKSYERVCLSCHTSGSGEAATVCPVNNRDKCIGCHMPSRPILPGSKVPLSISDHLIWAYRPLRR